MSKVLLHAKGLDKRFGAVVAAQDLQVSIRTGERISLIGSNGAGKTTFVNMVTGYIKPDQGRIEFDGQDITAMTPRQITRLGVARSFQIPQLYTSLSVQENMLVALSCQNNRLSLWRTAAAAQSLERAEAVLSRFNLLAQRHRLVAELPGGMRKLVDIALAMTGEPKLLLLDEPTSGVAAEEKFPMMDTVMQALDGQSLTVLFVEHDMEIVSRYGERVIAFYSGRIIADAVPALALANADVRRYVTGERDPQEASHA
ncbi:MAG: ABC transporter ATP-binding protein [Betaproteobacteria bacterium]|nr:ABC transporter ATP-binding protein [Betaproteobacteria bacterium]